MICENLLQIHNFTPTTQTSEMVVLAADLFAGAGGFSKAAINLGIEVRAAVEFDTHACSTYTANLGTGAAHPPKLFVCDINKLHISELNDCFPETRGCDLVLGGPPCQGFSVHRINGAGINDPRNELIHRYFETVEALKPKIFLLENVPGILWPRHAEYLKLFYLKAHAAGYKVEKPVILDARDYGVPQRRKRVFILGILKSLPNITDWPPKPTHGDATARKTDPSLKKWLTCRSAFRAAPDGDPNDEHMRHGDELIMAFKNTPLDGGNRRDSGRVLRCHKDHNGHKDVYGRIDRRKPAPTMTTACVNPSKGRFVHPTQHHGITVRQAARLQTFPDDYVFHGGLMAASKQIGNAVPVVMGEAVLRPIKLFLQTILGNHD